MTDSFAPPPAGASLVGTTLREHILSNMRAAPGATGQFTSLLNHLSLAIRIISSRVRSAGLANLLGYTGETNVQGEAVQKLDEYANDVLLNVLERSGHCGLIGSEEIEAAKVSHPGGKYVVLFDPLDGSSNIDTDVSIGTIFAILRRPPGELVPTTHDALQKGSEIVAAGYAVYGPSTLLALSTGHGVDVFTLDPNVGEFFLSMPNVRIPQRGNTYSINEGNHSRWSDGVKRWSSWIKEEKKEERRPYGHRYVGSMVADVHRTLVKGGIFAYPADTKSPKGKLRLLYEANPMAYIIEQAGGAASDGEQRILDIQPRELHQRCPVILGSKDDVEDYLAFAQGRRTLGRPRWRLCAVTGPASGATLCGAMLELDLRDLEAPRARFTFDQYVRAHDLASSMGLEPVTRLADEGLAPDGRRLYGARFAPLPDGAKQAVLLAARHAAAPGERSDGEASASVWNQLASELPDGEHEALARAVVGSPYVLAPAASPAPSPPKARRSAPASSAAASPAPQPAASASPPAVPASPPAAPASPPAAPAQPALPAQAAPASPPPAAAPPVAPVAAQPSAQAQLRLPITPTPPPVAVLPAGSSQALGDERSHLLSTLSTRLEAPAPPPAPSSPPPVEAASPAPVAAPAPQAKAPPARKPRAKKPAAPVAAAPEPAAPGPADPDPAGPEPALPAAVASSDDEAVRDLSETLSRLFPPVNDVASSQRQQHLVFVSAHRGQSEHEGLVVTMELLLLTAGDGGKLAVQSGRQQPVVLAGSRIVNQHERPRAKAFLEGWRQAVEAVLDRPAVAAAALMPHDFVAPQVLGQNALETPEQFRDALLDPSRLGRLLGG